ncbi:MAG: hypothetical protein PHC52_04970 [Syntrophales bacterium]|nr:hypothetical protein [Syntrophales bacterium]
MALNPAAEFKIEKLKRDLVTLALNGLTDLYDKERGLFCFRAARGREGLFREGASVRYTLISLLGIQAARDRGMETVLNPADFVSRLAAMIRKEETGEAGLLLWLCAKSCPDMLGEVYRRLHPETVWRTCHLSGEFFTMEMSWFLTGLAYASRAGGRCRNTGLMDEVFRKVRDYYGNEGIFGHQTGGSLMNRLRGAIGNFADQVYPIYAFAQYGKEAGNAEAVEIAVKCARTICAHQGPRGQWWWHYDMRTGRVVSRYPVFSVHQDAMAPMALCAAGKASGENFESEIERGLIWITGENELDREMIDARLNLVWRSIYKRKKMWMLEAALSLARLPGAGRVFPSSFRLQEECRPYHLGWILYAFA